MINPNYCPACGYKVTPGDAFCGKCGNPLGGKNPEESVVVEEKHEEEPRRPRRPLYIPQEEQNTLGVIGFVLTMVGVAGFWFTSWIGIGFLFIFLWPISLIVSFIAMFKKPRAFAVAGFIISLLECLGLLIVILFFGALFSAVFS